MENTGILVIFANRTLFHESGKLTGFISFSSAITVAAKKIKHCHGYYDVDECIASLTSSFHSQWTKQAIDAYER